MWNGARAKRAQNSAKRAQKSANEGKIKTCSIGCLTLAFFWQLCFASYHVDGTAQSIIASHDILVIMHEPIMNSMHGSWWHPWHCSTSSDRSIYRSCIPHPHEKTWKQPYTLEVLGISWSYSWACMFVIYLHGIHFFIFISYDNAYTRPSLAHKNLEHIFWDPGNEQKKLNWAEIKWYTFFCTKWRSRILGYIYIIIYIYIV